MPKTEVVPVADFSRDIPHLQLFALCDCVARQFAQTTPAAEANPKWRAFLQSQCVPGARWLWRHGGRDARACLASRIAVWRGFDPTRVRAIQTRVAKGGAL